MYKPKRKGLDLMTKKSLAGWLFVLPFLIGFLFFVLSPMYTSFMLSINSQDMVANTELCPQYVRVDEKSPNKGCYVIEMDENGELKKDAEGNYIFKLATDKNGNVKVDAEGNPEKYIENKPLYYVLDLTDAGDVQYNEDGSKKYEMVTNDQGESVRKIVNEASTKNTMKFVGIQNYSDAITKNLSFVENAGKAAGRLIYIPCILIFSFLIANVLNSKFVGRTVARVIFFMPVVTASGIAMRIREGNWEVARFGAAVQGSVSGTGMDMISSITNIMSQVEFLAPAVGFLSTAFDELSRIVLYSGIQILIFLAALQTISPSLFEASDVEGASKWEAFWKITFPMVSPMILVATVYTMIDVMVGSNNPMMSYLFGLTSSSIALSQRMAMGWMYFLVTAVLIVVVSLVISRFVYNENDMKVKKNRR